MKQFEIERGLDLFPGVRCRGPVIDSFATKVAVVGADFPDLRPEIGVVEGDRVKLGQALMTDRRSSALRFVAPAAGVVTAIHRGPKRSLLAIVIEVDADDEERLDAALLHKPSNQEDVRQLLLASGLWPALRQRPIERIPDPSASCDSLLITAIDTNPLAPDPAAMIERHTEAFLAGIECLALLGERTYLCTADSTIEGVDGSGAEHVRFVGPHPAGLPGTHVHYLARQTPSAWHIGYQDVIATGYLMLTGRRWMDREIGVAGLEPLRLGLVRTQLGASTAEVAGADAGAIVSGSVLSGRVATSATAFLGHYHNQISILPAPFQRAKRAAWLRLFARPRTADFEDVHCAAPRGGMLAMEAYDSIWPFPTPICALLRALLVRDTELAGRLGATMLVEEDLALASFMSPSKQDYGAALRETLTAIERGD